MPLSHTSPLPTNLPTYTLPSSDPTFFLLSHLPSLSTASSTHQHQFMRPLCLFFPRKNRESSWPSMQESLNEIPTQESRSAKLSQESQGIKFQDELMDTSHPRPTRLTFDSCNPAPVTGDGSQTPRKSSGSSHECTTARCGIGPSKPPPMVPSIDPACGFQVHDASSAEGMPGMHELEQEQSFRPSKKGKEREGTPPAKVTWKVKLSRSMAKHRRHRPRVRPWIANLRRKAT